MRRACSGQRRDGVREAIGRPTVLRAWIRQPMASATVPAVREALGDATFQAAWAMGGAMPLEVAVAYALEEIDLKPRRYLGTLRLIADELPDGTRGRDP